VLSVPSLPALPRYPSLYQINTRVWLTELATRLGHRASLDDVPDEDLDAIAELGFDWVWLLSAWSTGVIGREISRSDPGLRAEFERTLPDLRESDIAGSGFAITAYQVDPALGGDAALGRLRRRLRERGLHLMLDFVPNHTGLDHPWVHEHAERYVQGSEIDLVREPQNYAWVETSGGDVLLAHGRDPYFPGWTDTAQLDYSREETRAAMAAELLAISERCDGVRCDMAMLILPDVFERTWGRPALPFWRDAIGAVRRRHPGFTLMAEVYWDLEWKMLELGFDDAYDKRLYDRLRAGAAGPVRDHLRAGLDYQDHMARFLENHDEPRAAAAFPLDLHQAAALVTYLSPGLRFLHGGQLEGRRVHVSPHLVRAPDEPLDACLAEFYARLLEVLRRGAVRNGEWRLIDARPAWEGNGSVDGFICWTWTLGVERLLACVNLAAERGQCYVPLDVEALRGHGVRLTDLLGDAVYERDGDELTSRGLYLDVPAYAYHAFELTVQP
jgi:Alpha amylase, catalytic domain